MVKIFKIQFVANNTFGNYVTGDVVEIQIDPDLIVDNTDVQLGRTDGIVVYKNGVVSTTPTLIDARPNIISLQLYNAKICSSTSLVVFNFSTTYPYGNYYTLADHYSCATVPDVCDLILLGTPVVTNTTSETADDGEILVTAQSSNTIEYNLNEDFVYGSGQVTGEFTGLLKGIYRVYMRDSTNCGLSVLVEVGVGSSYGERFRLEYQDDAGFDTRIDIVKRDYTDAIDEVCGSGTPFEIQLRGEGSTDKFTPILSSQANFNLTSVTNSQFIELYTNDPNLYRLNYYKDTGTGFELKWTGKVLPFTYSEEYKNAPYYTTVTATDGLPELKDYYFFQPDGSRFTGTMSLIKLVAFLLSKLDLDLNIRVACNMYAVGMDTTDADDPFDQAYVDLELFYIEEKKPNYEFILTNILKPFGLRITQWDNRWNIVRVEELKDAYDYREFDSLGDYVSEGTFNPVVDVNYPTVGNVNFLAFPNMELQPGYGTIKANFKLGIKENILQNGDFSLNLKYFKDTEEYRQVINTDGWESVNTIGVPIYESFEAIDEDNIAWVLSHDDSLFTTPLAGRNFIQSKAYDLKMGSNNSLKISVTYNVKRENFESLLPYGITFPYVKVRIEVKYGSLYLTQSGAWTDSFTTIDFIETKLNEYITREIVAQQPKTGTPIAGMDFYVRVYHGTPLYNQFITRDAVTDFVTLDGTDQVIPTGYKTEMRDDFTLATGYIYYYELEEANTVSATLAYPTRNTYDLIQPDDYDATTNRRLWVLKYKRFLSAGLELMAFAIDNVKVEFLTNGKSPIDSIVRKVGGEKNNRAELDEKFIIGSLTDVIVTDGNQVFYDAKLRELTLSEMKDKLGIQGVIKFLNKDIPVVATINGSVIDLVTNILSRDILYTGWLRNSVGVAWEQWTRDGIAEADHLHGVWLRMTASQYNKTWRLLRATIVGRGEVLGLLNTFKEVNDDNRIYLPISVTLDDKSNTYSAELLEIGTGTETIGSDGTTTAPFTSAFTTGFGGGYN